MNEFEAGYIPEQPYWELREGIGEALIEGERRPLYLRLHAHPESYSTLRQRILHVFGYAKLSGRHQKHMDI